MERLEELGWTNIYDYPYTTYIKKIGDIELCVTKHNRHDKWKVFVIDDDKEIKTHDEVAINYDASYEWVVEFYNVMLKSKFY